MSSRQIPGLVAAVAVLAACSVTGSTESTDSVDTHAATTTPTPATTIESVPSEVLEAASDCVGIRLVGEALVLLATDIDEKIGMAETLSTSEDAQEMGVAMAESSTILQLEGDRMNELASFENREDLAEVASWVETGLRQTAENYNLVVDAMIEGDAEAMATAVSDFDRIWPAIVETMDAFTPLLEDCPGAEADILQGLQEAGQ